MPCFPPCPSGKNSPLGESILQAKINGTFVPLPKYGCRKANNLESCKGNVLLKRSKANAKVGIKFHKVELSAKELHRLKSAARVITIKDKAEELRRLEQESQRLEQEAERTRLHFKRIDETRKKKDEDSDAEKSGEKADENHKVLEKAFLAKHEDEEEVKKANRIILNAKCHAVRDAQIQEKRRLETAAKQEVMRIEKQVIEKAISSLHSEDAEYSRKQEEKVKYATEIRKQLQERETLRFLEAERVEEEAKMLRQAAEAIKADEMRQKHMAHENRIRFRNELSKLVEMSSVIKKTMCEQEREAELRTAAYIQNREQRLQVLATEKKMQQEELERKQQRIFNLAQKALESRSQREQISYFKEKERLEREYRRKEKQAVMKKKHFEKELNEARERQLNESKQRQALQLTRAEQEFNAFIDSMERDKLDEKNREEMRRKQMACYRNDIIRQITEKEQERRRMNDLERNDALAWREQERQRSDNIKEVINAKLSAMRAACLPEKYIKDVELQLRRMSNSRPSKLVH